MDIATTGRLVVFQGRRSPNTVTATSRATAAKPTPAMANGRRDADRTPRGAGAAAGAAQGGIGGARGSGAGAVVPAEAAAPTFDPQVPHQFAVALTEAPHAEQARGTGCPQPMQNAAFEATSRPQAAHVVDIVRPHQPDTTAGLPLGR